MTDSVDGRYNHAVATLPPLLDPLPFRSVPPEMRVGDMQTWQVDLSALPPGTYTLSYVFSAVINGAPQRFSFASGDIVDVSNLFTVTVPSSETKGSDSFTSFRF